MMELSLLKGAAWHRGIWASKESQLCDLEAITVL